LRKELPNDMVVNRRIKQQKMAEKKEQSKVPANWKEMSATEKIAWLDEFEIKEENGGK
jgi:hypothetical protein